MNWIKRPIVIASLAAALSAGMWVPPVHHVAIAQHRYATEPRRGFNDEYIFATTRSLNNAEGINPALKLTLFPVTIVLDTVFMPFAVIAGFVT